MSPLSWTSLLFHPTPLVCHRAPVWAPWVMQQIYTGCLRNWLFLLVLNIRGDINIYSKCLFIWLHWVLATAHRIFNFFFFFPIFHLCGMWVFCCGMWTLSCSSLQHVVSSSLTRDRTWAHGHWERGVLATRPPRKSPNILLMSFLVIHSCTTNYPQIWQFRQ